MTTAYDTFEHDVLVIGAGGAGLRAAIEAAAHGVKVGLVCKSLLGKAHTVMAEGGMDHVFKKLLEGEQEALKGENRHDTALTRQNYNFELVGYDTTPDGHSRQGQLRSTGFEYK